MKTLLVTVLATLLPRYPRLAMALGRIVLAVWPQLRGA
jgi:hypothetical protein